MTQKDLAGNQITRNMLSRIENGAAQPSMGTLLYLAGRLGVPAGFLIAEESDSSLYRKNAEMAKIRESFRRGDWKTCRRLCTLLGEQDAECERYICACLYFLARDCFHCGELHAAFAGFNALVERCSASSEVLYPDNVLHRHLIAESRVYLSCISVLSPLFPAQPSSVSLVFPVEPDDPFVRFYLYYHPNDWFTPSKRALEAYIAACPPEESFYAGHIRSLLLMQEEVYEEAAALLKQIAYGEDLIPQPELLFLLSDLEKCFRETGDFKGAYECAELHRELLDSFQRMGEPI